MSGKRNFAASLWGVLGTSAENVIQFVVFTVLAWLLPVADFGLVAFLMVMLDFSRIFVFGGLVQSVVQMPEWDDRVASICFTANLTYAAIFAILLTAVGAPLLNAYYQDGSGILLAVLSSSLVIDAARAVHVGKMRREFAFRGLATRGTLANLVAGLAALLAAYDGWGVWALIVHRLLASATHTIVTWRLCAWRPRLIISLAVLRQLAPFSVRATLAEFCNSLGSRATDLVVGALLGPVAVAYYRVASRSLEALTRTAIQPMQTAAFSVLARLGKSRIGDGFERLTGATAAMLFPVLVGIAVAAPEAIHLVFGVRYQTSGSILAILALGALPTAVIAFVSPSLMAAGEGRSILRLSVVSAMANLGFSLAFSFWGPVSAALGSALSQLVIAPYALWLVCRHFTVRGKTLLRNVIPPLIAAAAMGVAVMLVRAWLPSNMGPVERMLILVLVGTLIYSVALLLFGRTYLRLLWSEVNFLVPQLNR